MAVRGWRAFCDFCCPFFLCGLMAVMGAIVFGYGVALIIRGQQTYLSFVPTHRYSCQIHKITNGTCCTQWRKMSNAKPECTRRVPAFTFYALPNSTTCPNSSNNLQFTECGRSLTQLPRIGSNISCFTTSCGDPWVAKHSVNNGPGMVSWGIAIVFVGSILSSFFLVVCINYSCEVRYRTLSEARTTTTQDDVRGKLFAQHQAVAEIWQDALVPLSRTVPLDLVGMYCEPWGHELVWESGRIQIRTVRSEKLVEFRFDQDRACVTCQIDNGTVRFPVVSVKCTRDESDKSKPWVFGYAFRKSSFSYKSIPLSCDEEERLVVLDALEEFFCDYGISFVDPDVLQLDIGDFETHMARALARFMLTVDRHDKEYLWQKSVGLKEEVTCSDDISSLLCCCLTRYAHHKNWVLREEDCLHVVAHASGCIFVSTNSWMTKHQFVDDRQYFSKILDKYTDGR